MADIVDNADEHAGPLLDAQIEAIRSKASQIPPGTPGDCDMCGEWSGRLINGACSPCRDRYHLP